MRSQPVENEMTGRADASHDGQSSDPRGWVSVVGRTVVAVVIASTLSIMKVPVHTDNFYLKIL